MSQQIEFMKPRLDEFRSLKNGWLDGKGIAPKSQQLDWLMEQFKAYLPDELPCPFLYPTAEGGVQAEWSIGPFEISLDIALKEKRGCWHRLNTNTGRDSECELDLADIEAWRWIGAQLGALKGTVNHDA